MRVISLWKVTSPAWMRFLGKLSGEERVKAALRTSSKSRPSRGDGGGGAVQRRSRKLGEWRVGINTGRSSKTRPKTQVSELAPCYEVDDQVKGGI